MEIKHTDGRFYLGDADHPQGVLDYRFTDDKTVQAYHTQTSEEVQAQGVAGKLFDAFIAYVNEHDLKVQADCSYVEKKMKENEDYSRRLV